MRIKSSEIVEIKFLFSFSSDSQRTQINVGHKPKLPPKPLPKNLRPFNYLNPSNDMEGARALKNIIAQARSGLSSKKDQVHKQKLVTEDNDDQVDNQKVEGQ